MPDPSGSKPQINQEAVINHLLGQIANLHLQVALLQSQIKKKESISPTTKEE